MHRPPFRKITRYHSPLTSTSESIEYLAFLQQHAPMLYKNLQEAAESEGQTMEEHLQSYDTLLGYFEDVMDYCYDEITQARQRPLVLVVLKPYATNVRFYNTDYYATNWQNIKLCWITNCIKRLKHSEKHRLGGLKVWCGFVLEKSK